MGKLVTTLMALTVAGALLAGCGSSSGAGTTPGGADQGASGTAQPSGGGSSMAPGSGSSTAPGGSSTAATVKPAKIMVDGAELPVSGSTKPHQHEDAAYAPAKDLATALKVTANVDDKAPSVTVNGTTLKAGSGTPKGTHEHGGVVFVKVEDFAKAAGYKFAWDAASGTATLSK